MTPGAGPFARPGGVKCGPFQRSRGSGTAQNGREVTRYEGIACTHSIDDPRRGGWLRKPVSPLGKHRPFFSTRHANGFRAKGLNPRNQGINR